MYFEVMVGENARGVLKRQDSYTVARPHVLERMGLAEPSGETPGGCDETSRLLAATSLRRSLICFSLRLSRAG